MEAPGLDCELGGQDYRESIDQSLMGTHEGNSHVIDSNIIASLSYEHAQTGQKLSSWASYLTSLRDLM